MRRLIIIILGLFTSSVTAAAPSTQPVLDRFNYIIGTQDFNPSYHFTTEPALLEAARAIQAMGSNTIKFGFTPTSRSGERANFKSLADYARLDPTRRAMLEMPFANYILWAHTFAEVNWHDGLSEDERNREYHELYDFASYLLKTYSGTGKTFFIGHWEGDWLLRGKGKKDVIPTPVAMQGMTDWFNARQQAIDDAKRDTPHHNVEMFNYAEVNLVRIGMEGKPCLTTDVIPKTNVDYVSYSSYDCESDPKELTAALSFIESHMQPKPSIKGKRVFIGEYGFPAYKFSPQQQERKSRDLMIAGLRWGCPFILYWEMYNNEVKDGHQQGFWLIDDKNTKQPIYNTHYAFYQWAHQFIDGYQREHNSPPSFAEFSSHGADFLEHLAP